MPSIRVPVPQPAKPKAAGEASPALSLPGGGDALERVFASGGLLARALPNDGRTFEDRPQQREMAQAVARAVDEKTHLLVEAGTGTGKSYAYLVPLILWAVANNKKVLVATGTKALQQQLVERDLPFLRDLFVKRMGLEFRFALCLGTGNYLCPRRLAKAETNGLFASKDEVEQLKELRDWGGKSKTGRLLDLTWEPPASLWSQVNRESDLCIGRACSLYEKSFYYIARRQAEKAHVLVANHHLLFAHLASGGNEAGMVLPPFDALVLDEAHGCEDVASAYLGREIVNLGVARLIELLHHRKSGKTVLSGAPLAEVKEWEPKLIEAADEAREATGRFFANLLEALPLDPHRPQTLRIRRPGVVEDCLSEPFKRLEDVMRMARKGAERIADEALMREWEGYATRCASVQDDAKALVEHKEAGYVYWASLSPRVADGQRAARVPRIALCGAPVEVAEAMQKSLFGPICPVIMTSATLSAGGSFEFLRQRLGLDIGETEVRELSVGSPFDFKRNALIYVARDLPDPGNPALFEPEARKRAAEIIKRTQGRAFVLCTSFRTVDAMADLFRSILPKKIKVLKQGEGSRGKLLADFRRDVNSVLVGTTSFWQGVDVPGEALSCVIITKLPFAVPDDPLVQARVEKLKQNGHDAFNEYQVPQAVMMFRQGFGRLIRTATDRGIVAVLDPRVVTKKYGETFLKSLPDCEITDDLDLVARFLEPPKIAKK